MAEKQFVTFYLGDDLFGLNIMLVREINRNMDITPVDKAPEYVRGLLNLRGQIVTVLDLAERLGLGLREELPSSCCMILKTSGELERMTHIDELNETTISDKVGLFVDRIGDVVTVKSEDVEPASLHNSGVASRFIDGVVKLENRLLVTLKPSEILSAATEEDIELQLQQQSAA